MKSPIRLCAVAVLGSIGLAFGQAGVVESLRIRPRPTTRYWRDRCSCARRRRLRHNFKTSCSSSTAGSLLGHSRTVPSACGTRAERRGASSAGGGVVRERAPSCRERADEGFELCGFGARRPGRGDRDRERRPWQLHQGIARNRRFMSGKTGGRRRSRTLRLTISRWI